MLYPLSQCLLLGSTRTVMPDILYDVSNIPLVKTKEDFFFSSLLMKRKEAGLLKKYIMSKSFTCV